LIIRRILVVACIALCVCGMAWAVSAQDSTRPAPPPTVAPPTPDAVETAIAILERAERNNDRAIEQANNTLNTANGFLSFVQAVTSVAAIFAAIAGYVGFVRLQTLEKKVSQATEAFETEIKQKRTELETLRREVELRLDTLRDELRQSAQKIREDNDKSTQEQSRHNANANTALALLPLGERQYRAQDYQGAISTYQRALDLDRQNPITHYRLAYVYTQAAMLDEALPNLQRALEITPDFAPALANMGYIYRRKAEKQPVGLERDTMMNEAEKCLLRALTLSPKLIDEDGESWWGSLGGLYRRRHQIDEALHAYRQAAEVTPYSSYPYTNLALLYLEKQDREQMLQTYRRVEYLAARLVNAQVDNYWAYSDLLVARMALGKYDEASITLETIVNTPSISSPYMIETLIDTLIRLQKVMSEEERAQMQRVIQYLQNHPRVQQTKG
jgi:tetratricopeptide (TPR) repeat protein